MMNTYSKSKSALMASGLSLVLCLAMLIGTTFAWFSDSVSNKGNRIQAGKLAVGFTASDTLENSDLGSTGLGDLADESIKLFDLANWAPGDTYTRYMRVKNLGSLALKYNINFVLSGDNSLADAIKLDVTPAVNTPTVVNGSNVSAATAENIEMNGVLAKADDFQIFKVDLSFLESAGNTYQGGIFGLDVNLVATQNNANANIITAKDASAFANVPANSTIVLQKDITTAETIAITEFVNIDLNGYTLTCKDFSIVKDDAIGTIDVANGKIVADNIKISAEKGSVNVSNLNGTVSATGKVSLNGSMNTVNILKGTQFIISGTESPAPIEIQSETRVVVKTEEPVKFMISSGSSNISIVDQREGSTEKVEVEVASGVTDIVVVNNPDTDSQITVSGEGAGEVQQENIQPYFESLYPDGTKPADFLGHSDVTTKLVYTLNKKEGANVQLDKDFFDKAIWDNFSYRGGYTFQFPLEVEVVIVNNSNTDYTVRKAMWTFGDQELSPIGNPAEQTPVYCIYQAPGQVQQSKIYTDVWEVANPYNINITVPAGQTVSLGNFGMRIDEPNKKPHPFTVTGMDIQLAKV